MIFPSNNDNGKFLIYPFAIPLDSDFSKIIKLHLKDFIMIFFNLIEEGKEYDIWYLLFFILLFI